MKPASMELELEFAFEPPLVVAPLPAPPPLAPSFLADCEPEPALPTAVLCTRERARARARVSRECVQ